MKYNLNNPIHRQNFKEYANKLFEQKEYVELKKVIPPKSNSQMGYLFILFGYFAMNYGDTVEYVKEEIFKKQVNRDIFEAEFVNRHTGEVRKGWRSLAVLDSRELTHAIDKFRTWSSKEAGIYLPLPNEKDFLREAQIEIEKVKEHI